MNKQALATLTFLTTSLPGTVLALEVDDQLEVFGGINAIYGHYRTQQDDGSGTITTTTNKGVAAQAVTLGAIFKPNDKFDITTSLLYEEEVDTIVTPTEFDQAFVTAHALPDGKLDISAGKQYLPFGKFETAMIHDPVTLDFAEGWSNETLIASSKHGNITTQAYGFRSKENLGGDYGLSINYENEEQGLSAGIDYLANLSAPDNFAGVNNVNHRVPGIALHGSSRINERVKVFGEHIFATKKFDNGTSAPVKPSASHVEAQIDLNQDRTVAVSWEGSKNANKNYFDGLPKSAYGVTYSQPIYKQLFGAVEVKKSKDYDNLKTNSITGQLSYEF